MSGYSKMSSRPTPNARAIWKASSSVGEYFCCSIAMSVCRVTPTVRASSAWVRPACSR
ncbi:hypothetical protein OG1X_0501 [Enterococcus faecalis OG1X]|nr:hypothetical protein OG1X_0501 [Enterococcus faecalis OG1X]